MNSALGAALVLPTAVSDPRADTDELAKRILDAAVRAVALAEGELAALEREQLIAREQGASWEGGTRLRMVTLALKTASEVIGSRARVGKARPR